MSGSGGSAIPGNEQAGGKAAMVLWKTDYLISTSWQFVSGTGAGTPFLGLGLTGSRQSAPPRATDGGNLLTADRQFWHCGAHTAEPKIGAIAPTPPIPYYQNLRFSVARGTATSCHSVQIVGSGGPTSDQIWQKVGIHQVNSSDLGVDQARLRTLFFSHKTM